MYTPQAKKTSFYLEIFFFSLSLINFVRPVIIREIMASTTMVPPGFRPP